MSSPRAVLVALVALTIAACSAGPATQPTATAQVTVPPVTAAPVVTTEPPTEPPTPRPTPKPTPKLIPVPPKPTGLQLSLACGWGDDGGECDTGPDGASRLSWTKPRSKGVEVRVYGVTKCFRTDAPDGPCLREHTAVPEDIRVLLAKAPASKGGLSFSHYLERVETQEGCVYGYLSKDGTSFSSIVVAAYSASGHSTFAIADGGYYDRTCGIDPD